MIPDEQEDDPLAADDCDALEPDDVLEPDIDELLDPDVADPPDVELLLWLLDPPADVHELDELLELDEELIRPLLRSGPLTGQVVTSPIHSVCISASPIDSKRRVVETPANIGTYIVQEFVRYYNGLRSHSRRDYLPPAVAEPPPPNDSAAAQDIVRQERLGGVIAWYERRAA